MEKKTYLDELYEKKKKIEEILARKIRMKDYYQIALKKEIPNPMNLVYQADLDELDLVIDCLQLEIDRIDKIFREEMVEKERLK